ncbi:hypothetical protein DSCOOX_47710 [Desulfosarcina ovata subsp. ovata]|uniref:Alpha/beta hydrolase n=2 Tax=Desulfosarcina ovata TaxID=83564 RepID=A0A5K8AG48_9BACT|nr:hypothetical protein DSCOOX_47710 [Desulfosarcina ovata subsp. ovata]
MHLPPTFTQNIGEVWLQYIAYESGQPTIVLLHATGFLPWLWHPIATQLAPAHQVIAPYFCDHRQADAYQGGLDWMLLASDLAALCKAIDPILQLTFEFLHLALIESGRWVSDHTTNKNTSKYDCPSGAGVEH